MKIYVALANFCTWPVLCWQQHRVHRRMGKIKKYGSTWPIIVGNKKYDANNIHFKSAHTVLTSINVPSFFILYFFDTAVANECFPINRFNSNRKEYISRN